MTSPRRLGLIVAACCLSGGGPMGTWLFGTGAQASPATDTLNACEQAGAAAEQAGGLPAGLLLAIGRVESGRWDSNRARITPWPWAMNAAGKGQWFETKAEAAESVRAMLDAGTRSIDVGCFQISLLYHPAAFANLEQAFDPDANARYATRFLLSLFSRTGSWEAAVEAYHSSDPTLGFAYRQQVFSSWSSVGAFTARPPAPIAAIATAPEAKSVPMPMVIGGIQIWTPMPAGTGATTVAMPSQAGMEAPRETLTASPMPPLPVVSYRIMPRR